MPRPSLVLVVGLLTACGGHRSAEASAPPAAAAVQEDSVRAIVARYEAGEVPLIEATRQLADLIEPKGGFAVSGNQSARATELFEATSRELQRRDAKRLGVTDSLVSH